MERVLPVFRMQSELLSPDPEKGALLITTLVFCETCKADTARCEYYPAGRSRQHGKCLECDRKDIRNPRPSGDKRYCVECDRNHRTPPDRYS